MIAAPPIHPYSLKTLTNLANRVENSGKKYQEFPLTRGDDFDRIRKEFSETAQRFGYSSDFSGGLRPRIHKGNYQFLTV
jgi:hypothetical protein